MNPASNVVAIPPAEELIRVAPGEYSALYVGHEGVTVFRAPKLRVEFRLLEHPEIVLPRWYRVIDYRRGRVRARQASDLVRELSAALGRRLRADRVPISDIKNVVVRVLVKDVTRDGHQRALHPINVYSVIEGVTGAQP